MPRHHLPYDFLILGQGLAGTVLSYTLLSRGYRVLVCDTGAGKTSSRVAAGLYNPITGRKMNKTWWADRLFPRITPFYRELERVTGCHFLHERPIYRPFISVEEQNDWQARAADPAFIPYIQALHLEPQYPEVKADPFGGLELAMSGWLDLPVLLDGYRSWLLHQQALLEEEVPPGTLEPSPHGFCYQNLETRFVVDCTGNAARHSPWFGWLPFRPVMGEIITVASDFNPSRIVNRGVFMVPFGESQLRVGSTYHWQQLSTEPRPEGITEIREKMEQLAALDYELVQAEAGIRPATKDRRPMLGRHPRQERMLLFNGLGAKGVSLAPYMAECFCDWISEKQPLPDEVNVKRFFSLYSNDNPEFR